MNNLSHEPHSNAALKSEVERLKVENAELCDKVERLKVQQDTLRAERSDLYQWFEHHHVTGDLSLEEKDAMSPKQMADHAYELMADKFYHAEDRIRSLKVERDAAQSELAVAIEDRNSRERELKEAQAACNEAWNAFENGKRKHHRDALTGGCISGCQACAIEKLSAVLKP